MESNKNVVVSSQGEDKYQKGGAVKKQNKKLPLLMIWCWLYNTIVFQHNFDWKYLVQLDLFTQQQL